ncbi:uncharacterized protein LOC143279652 isoform X2 [Babylonia areolata]|uniref:uncharacterized protein LOC143279652 isoform X2 n=1 Tax=Babylonia areolata TaxID=304850 RepID=UPI003FD6A2A5
MAEEDTSGLELLIQQRINRPPFARMISWEISKSSEDPPHKAGKSGHHEKASSPLEENELQGEELCCKEKESEGSESDESVYFSAEESIPENQTDNSDDEESSEKNMDGSNEDQDVSSFLAASYCQSGKERQRGRTKKQKKKRRRQAKEGYINYTEYTAPFQLEENINFSISSLRQEVVCRTENTSARVPSLFELCAHFIWSKSSRLPALHLHLLPRPMKKAVSVQQQSHAFSSLQLSCLYRNLGELEEKARADESVLVTRNVWSKVYAVKWHSSRHIETSIPQDLSGRRGQEVTMVIPYCYAVLGQADHERWCQVEPRDSLYKTSLMVSTLDLMAPAHFRPPRKKGTSVSTMEEEDLMLVIYTDVIRRNLQKRYPLMLELFWKKAIPYFFWLRGHSKLALDHFLQLCDATEDIMEKASILLEAALLCQLQCQADSARQFFKQSHELLLGIGHVMCDQRKIDEINEQQWVLCANTYDQGVLTEEKALKSLALWQHLTTMPCCPSSAQAAAESVLCFHLAHLPGQDIREKIGFVLSHIQKCCDHCWRVSLHLSLLHAWLGNRTQSVTAFDRMAIADDTPGLQFKPNVYSGPFTPWQVVCDAASNKPSLKPLTVVWRTQLGLARVVSDGDAFCGQLHGRQGLRVSPEGHLTDDIHLLLPPVRALQLDLHTGKLILPSTPGQTHVQTTLFNSWHRLSQNFDSDPVEFQYPNGSYALTSTELYSDDTGRHVHLLTSAGTAVLKTHVAVAHLQLTSANGTRTKLNFKQTIKTALRKETEKKIVKTFEGRPKDMERALKGLEYTFHHNTAFCSEYFLDVSSKEMFTSPTTYVFDDLRPDCKFDIVGRQGHRVPRSDVLCLRVTDHQQLRVFGQGGEVLQYSSADLQHRDVQCVLGSSLYYIENSVLRDQGQDVTLILSELRFHQEVKAETFIYDLDPELREVKPVGDWLLLVRSDGLRVLHPQGMMPVPLLCHPDSECRCPLSADRMTVLVKPIQVSVLAEKRVVSPAGLPTVVVPVAVNDYLLVLSLQERCCTEERVVEVVFCVRVPGHVTECCFIGHTVGYVISTTLHPKSNTSYPRETLCHLNLHGQLLSLLPCLGPGPHCLLPVLLPPPPSSRTGEEEGGPAWHVYLRDGHEGIICVKL